MSTETVAQATDGPLPLTMRKGKVKESELLAVAMFTLGPVRRQLLSLLPPYSFRDRSQGLLYHRLAQALSTAPDSFTTGELSALAGVDPVALLSIELDLPQISLKDAAKNLLAQRVADCLNTGIDPAPYALALAAIADTSDKSAIAGDTPGGPTWPAAIDMQRLSQVEPAIPKFIMDEWLPCGYMTLFAGHGGVGKSALALLLAVCIAMGRMFIGLPVERRRVIYCSCEDRENVLHWRLYRICSFLGISISELDGWLQIIDLVGHDSIIYQPQRVGSPLMAPYHELSDSISRYGSQVLFIDGINDTYAGDENNKAQVKAYVNALLALIPPDDGAVILIGHVAKQAANMKTAEGYSGTTGWHNAARSRWYLYPETIENHKSGDLLLELQKSNLGPSGRAMRFRWNKDAGMFLGNVDPTEEFTDCNARDRQERDEILAVLVSCQDYVPAATTGNRTAFHVLSSLPNFPKSLRAGNADRKRFWKHIETLRAMGLITESHITRSDRHKKLVLVPTDAACGHAGNGEFDYSTHIDRTTSAGMRAMPAGGYRGSEHPQSDNFSPVLFTESDFAEAQP